MEKLYRVVTESNGIYSIRAPYMADDVEKARAKAREEQPNVRIVTDAEELAQALLDVSDERRNLRSDLEQMAGELENTLLHLDKVQKWVQKLPGPVRWWLERRRS